MVWLVVIDLEHHKAGHKQTKIWNMRMIEIACIGKSLNEATLCQGE
jgi:hypothetical protein